MVLSHGIVHWRVAGFGARRQGVWRKGSVSSDPTEHGIEDIMAVNTVQAHQPREDLQTTAPRARMPCPGARRYWGLLAPHLVTGLYIHHSSHVTTNVYALNRYINMGYPSFKLYRLSASSIARFFGMYSPRTVPGDKSDNVPGSCCWQEIQIDMNKPMPFPPNHLSATQMHVHAYSVG